MTRDQEIREVEAVGGKGAGRKQLLVYLQGGRITPSGAIAARCYQCQGYCEDGKPVCETETCGLFPFSPYNPQKVRSRAKSEAMKARRGKDTEDAN